MRDYQRENLSHDPIHGYMPFTSNRGLAEGEVSEQQIIDHPWVQRLRQIHQLQTAWWVYPSAEHTRFQHVLGVMYLASRAVASVYESLKEVCPDVPSAGYVESLLRLSGLLHDVGHGPFGHFFDEHFLSQYGLTHETLGSAIIRQELGDLIRGVRRTPTRQLAPQERLDPDDIAYLITRPRDEAGDHRPKWLKHLRALFSGVYTLDNMDFVLRDAYMTGYSRQAFDLDRLLHYSFYTEQGLTLHDRGQSSLVRFITVRGELFRTIYFHRTVRSIDLTLQDLFSEGREYLFPGNPLERLAEYRRFTEFSLLVDVARWIDSDEPRKRKLGEKWQRLLEREVHWKLACERSLFYRANDAESASIFSNKAFFEQAFRAQLPDSLKNLPLRFDLARHVHRPGTKGATAGLNFLFKSDRRQIVQVRESDLVRHLPVSWRLCRIYAETGDHNASLAAALDRLIGPGGEDDITNM